MSKHHEGISPAERARINRRARPEWTIDVLIAHCDRCAVQLGAIADTHGANGLPRLRNLDRDGANTYQRKADILRGDVIADVSELEMIARTAEGVAHFLRTQLIDDRMSAEEIESWEYDARGEDLLAERMHALAMDATVAA